MPRPHTILQSTYPYNISARSINREWFNLPAQQTWEIFSRRLYTARFRFNLRIHSFVLMANHFHLLASTPDANLSEAMHYLMKNTSSDLNLARKRINQAYGTRFFRSIIQDHHHFTHVYKYNYLNPVKAGICSRAEDYPYSTLHGLLGRSHLMIPVEEDTLLFDDINGTLTWLNNHPHPEDWETIKNAARKATFKLPKNRNKQLHRLETARL